jgi:hypothetical protein
VTGFADGVIVVVVVAAAAWSAVKQPKKANANA